MTDQTNVDDTADTSDVPDWLIHSRVYDILKWVALIVLPALATLVQALGPVWGWTWADPAATSITAVALAVGVIIGASHLKAITARKS
ncbi:phage holin [Bifidobacterium aerophilum]|uniref:Holin n=1 Tax=Bifidobacterium aerophilum TaxID=1798155 RepID=A0A6N9Z958_9BIFI|nr:phage holin [Bifidobacterium aerophilum]NEG90615.1 holin [Bifidobacterium aerophilum]